MKDSDKFLRELTSFLLEIRDGREMTELLRELLTPKELEEIPRRLQIVKQLKRGTPQREISESLGVGIATVTRGARVMNSKPFAKLK